MAAAEQWEPELYDALYESSSAAWDIALYRALTSAASGPVLELGAGSARVLRSLLAAGVDAFGLELDPVMARAGRKKLWAAGITDAHERLLEGDMRCFDHSTRYAMVILPCNSLSLLLNDSDVVDMLSAVARHLVPQGEFAFDVDLLAPATVGCSRMQPLVPSSAEDPISCVVDYARVSGEHVELRHVYAFPDGSERCVRYRLRQRSAAHLQELLSAAGFEFVAPPCDEKGQAIHSDSHLLIARCRYRGSGLSIASG